MKPSVRLEARHNVNCAEIVTCTGNSIPWPNIYRYLGVFFMSHSVFKCNYENAKKSLFLRVVMLYLVKLDDTLLLMSLYIIIMLLAKCFPALL